MDPSAASSPAADPEREVERVVSHVRYGAFRALRLVGTTLGLLNLAAAALQYILLGAVTGPLRAAAIGQAAVIGSSWLFNEKSHRVGAAVHLALVAALAGTMVNVLGFTTGTTGLMLWLCVTGAVFYGQRGAIVSASLVLALLAAFVVRVAVTGVPAPVYGAVFAPVDLSVRWSVAVLTVGCVLGGTVVALVKGLENATRELFGALLRERAAHEANAKSRAELERVRRTETVGRLAGGIAHDLNNMLAPVLTWATLLLEQRPKDPEVVEACTAIATGARNAGQLSRQLLAFSRPGTQSRGPVELHRVLEATVALMRRTLHRSIDIELTLGAPRSVVMGDEALLQSAFANLMLNARDAMPKGGRLSIVTSSPAPGRIEVTLTDTGVGMTPEVQAQVFELYFTTKEQGSGFGLASVYATVQGHSGSIEVSSEVEKGSTFKLQFPLTDAVPATVAVVEAEARGKVLVVDDEELVRRVIVKYLERRGFECRTARDGREGLEAFERERDVTLIILDSVMPNMSGSEMLTRVRLLDQNVPVLMVSGYLKDGNAADVAKDPRVSMVGKPFAPDDLLAAVNQLLARKPPAG